jgi:hypothetical protein
VYGQGVTYKIFCAFDPIEGFQVGDILQSYGKLEGYFTASRNTGFIRRVPPKDDNTFFYGVLNLDDIDTSETEYFAPNKSDSPFRNIFYGSQLGLCLRYRVNIANEEEYVAAVTAFEILLHEYWVVKRISQGGNLFRYSR